MINKIAERAYTSAVDRGIMKPYNTLKALKWASEGKIQEELIEFLESAPCTEFDKNSEQSEIADVMMVMMTYAYACGYDVEKLLLDKLEFNETRED